jgi:hypothetical protein
MGENGKLMCCLGRRKEGSLRMVNFKKVSAIFQEIIYHVRLFPVVCSFYCCKENMKKRINSCVLSHVNIEVFKKTLQLPNFNFYGSNCGNCCFSYDIIFTSPPYPIHLPFIPSESCLTILIFSSLFPLLADQLSTSRVSAHHLHRITASHSRKR